jgi:hypothetical protein
MPGTGCANATNCWRPAASLGSGVARDDWYGDGVPTFIGAFVVVSAIVIACAGEVAGRRLRQNGGRLRDDANAPA